MLSALIVYSTQRVQLLDDFALVGEIGMIAYHPRFGAASRSLHSTPQDTGGSRALSQELLCSCQQCGIASRSEPLRNFLLNPIAANANQAVVRGLKNHIVYVSCPHRVLQFEFWFGVEREAMAG